MGLLPSPDSADGEGGRLNFEAIAKVLLVGNGDPAGKVRAPQGVLFLRQDGGAATSLYVKEADSVAGDPTQGWAPK